MAKITVKNPKIAFDASKGEKNPNHMIAGVAVNGDAEIRVTLPVGATAVVEGNKTLPGIIPVWVWNKFRDSDIGTNYIKEGRLVVTGDPVAAKLVKVETSPARKPEKVE